MRKALPWLLLLFGLGVLGLVAALFAPHVDRAASAASSEKPVVQGAPRNPGSPALDALGVKKPEAVDPTDLLAHVKSRASAWHRDAVLVSMSAQPVRKGLVDLTNGGSVEYNFARADGPLNPGSAVKADRLIIRVDASGPSEQETRAGAGRSTAEPNCSLAEAFEAARAAGLSDDAGIAVRYEMSDRHGKSVWQLSSLSDTKSARTVDGWTCAILVR